jgi:hypothetical protein
MAIGAPRTGVVAFDLAERGGSVRGDRAVKFGRPRFVALSQLGQHGGRSVEVILESHDDEL